MMLVQRQRCSLFLLTFVLVLVGRAVSVSLNDGEKAGADFFLAGIRLVEEDKLDEAAMNFWGSVLRYSDRSDDVEPIYKVDEAMNNFLLCYQKQNKLALGYAFVAAQMFQAKDARGRQFLQKAYVEDPTNADVLQLLAHMGETAESILSDRVYSAESIDAGDSTALPTKTTKAHACRTKADCQSFFHEPPNLDTLEPGWEDIVERDHSNTRNRLINTPPLDITIPPLPQFEVYYDKFWKTHFHDKDESAEPSWEPYTFTVLHRYLTKDTVMVDLGAWCGPTSLYGAQLAKRVFSLEPDPVAYTTLDMNVQLNQAAANASTTGFPNNMHVHPIAVVAPQDAGYVILETGKKGNSESMITTSVGTKEETFEAAGYTLPFLFNLWGIQFEEQPVFIKIDIETYECSLIPSFYEWLSAESSNIEKQTLTMFVSFHPQLRPCTLNQMKGVLKTLTLFTTVECNQQSLPKITDKTTFSEFETMLDKAGCLTNKDTADFVLIA